MCSGISPCRARVAKVCSNASSKVSVNACGSSEVAPQMFWKLIILLHECSHCYSFTAVFWPELGFYLVVHSFLENTRLQTKYVAPYSGLLGVYQILDNFRTKEGCKLCLKKPLRKK